MPRVRRLGIRECHPRRDGPSHPCVRSNMEVGTGAGRAAGRRVPAGAARARQALFPSAMRDQYIYT